MTWHFVTFVLREREKTRDIRRNWYEVNISNQIKFVEKNFGVSWYFRGFDWNIETFCLLQKTQFRNPTCECFLVWEKFCCSSAFFSFLFRSLALRRFDEKYGKIGFFLMIMRWINWNVLLSIKEIEFIFRWFCWKIWGDKWKYAKRVFSKNRFLFFPKRRNFKMFCFLIFSSSFVLWFEISLKNKSVNERINLPNKIHRNS